MTIARPSIRSGKGDSIGFMPILSLFFNVNYLFTKCNKL